MMRPMLTVLCAAGAAVFAALIGRREISRQVENRELGTPVELGSLASVLDIGDGLWRGPAPTAEGYADLAAAGCSLVVDLRSEPDHRLTQAAVDAAGLELLVLATENTRPPTPEHIQALSAAHASATGTTYVHCQAGEGRTGAILGAYQVQHGERPMVAIRDALSVGSLTFSQIVYIASAGRSRTLVTAIDRLVDRPTEALIQAVASGR